MYERVVCWCMTELPAFIRLLSESRPLRDIELSLAASCAVCLVDHEPRQRGVLSDSFRSEYAPVQDDTFIRQRH